MDRIHLCGHATHWPARSRTELNCMGTDHIGMCGSDLTGIRGPGPPLPTRSRTALARVVPDRIGLHGHGPHGHMWLGPHWHAWSRTAFACVDQDRIRLRGHGLQVFMDRIHLCGHGPHRPARSRTELDCIGMRGGTNMRGMNLIGMRWPRTAIASRSRTAGGHGPH